MRISYRIGGAKESAAAVLRGSESSSSSTLRLSPGTRGEQRREEKIEDENEDEDEDD
jgi:hypothetical protein